MGKHFIRFFLQNVCVFLGKPHNIPFFFEISEWRTIQPPTKIATDNPTRLNWIKTKNFIVNSTFK